MARGIHRLTAMQIAKARRKGATVADGGGLYLQRGRSWVLRYARHGKSHWMGLGPIELVDLPAAREAALEKRKLLFAGVDPLVQRARVTAQTMTFAECCEAYIKAHQATWRNPKHAAQWTMTLLGRSPEGVATKANYCAILQPLPVADIDTALIMRALEPIWRDRLETAARLRGRIETILSWAAVRGFRSGENPARWKRHLDQLLPAKHKVRAVQHHAALSHTEVPAFLADLRRQEGTAARAFEFTILCATRTGDVIGQKRADGPPLLWSHLDLVRGLWVIPRTKSGMEHRVPLSNAALAVLEAMPREGDIVFPGHKRGQPLSNGAMLAVLRRMGRRGLSVHGFRACFKTWAAEFTSFERDTIEAALTHVVGSKLERAYRRGDLLEKRARLMGAWADFCNGTLPYPGVVVPLRA